MYVISKDPFFEYLPKKIKFSFFCNKSALRLMPIPDVWKNKRMSRVYHQCQENFEHVIY